MQGLNVNCASQRHSIPRRSDLIYQIGQSLSTQCLPSLYNEKHPKFNLYCSEAMPAAAKPKTLAVDSPAAAAATKTATPVKESAPTPDTPKVPYVL
jgi:hypothetical protein